MRRWRVLLSTVVVTLAACGTHVTPPVTAPSTSPVRSAVVPWRALPATRPVIPSTRIPPRPDPARARQARTCHGSDLVMHRRGAGAAAGTSVQNVVVDLAPGRRPCAVSHRPTAVAHTVEGTTIPGRPQMWSELSHAPVLLTPRRHALVQLTWPSACISDHTGQASFTLQYAGGSWTWPLRDLSDTCDFGADRPLTTIGVSRFVPLHLHPARTVSAFDAVRARGPARLVARPDQPIDFVVTLVARHDVVLEPCPDYLLGASPANGQRFALNCAGVPWRDADGTPYLPAGRPVRFAMHLAGTEGAVQKFWWDLLAPGSPPAVGGEVVIR